MVEEQKERQIIEGLASGAEQVAVLVTSYYRALIEKGFSKEIAEKMAVECSHLYFESMFKGLIQKQ